MRKHLLMLLCCVAAPAMTSVKYETQDLNGHSTNICVSSGKFSHDYYTLVVDKNVLFNLPDDYVEDIVLTHRAPEDAAIEFPAQASSAAWTVVRIIGGCVPVSEKKRLGGKVIGVEVARVCSFKWVYAKVSSLPADNMLCRFPSCRWLR
ncbi:hypothetical protein [Pandoraea bronchicola]|uniref:Uncharacterized protein n=1 Tax=Pandoraea bronchicola TaxID=2508287 RepID=A0A5E5BX08_9BURK|nr:hypothetical protein [Pandoraea bronchicola]VVE89856.1 hypothetical protein PBR20603_03829 [Pandoraea bronchicola]